MLKTRKKSIISTSLAGISIILIQSLESKNILTSIGKGTIRTGRRAAWGDNFHTVEPNILYRSRQLSPEKLDHYIKKYGIKTVINLRGKDESKEWWQQEQNVIKQNNGLLFNIEMDARNKITPLDKLIQLGAILLAAPTPMLVHCQAGSDRTGEACALFKLLHGSSTEEALEQLTPYYGHFAYNFPRKRNLIKNLNTIYPKYIENMLRLQPQNRFSLDELKALDAEGLLIKLQEN